MEENEKKKRSRSWVKDAAIIFLAVLLVLTFFSNTILNRSLPEVATVYVQEGTITNKVRGTGTISARENYDVTIEQTRQVQSVQVRVGDEVKAGDVLFTLQPGDSDELEQAQKQLKQMEKDLRSLENEYQIWLLSLTETDDYEQDQAISDAREALQDAREALADAAISDEERAEYEEDLAEQKAKIAEYETKIDAQKAVVDAKQAEIDEKQASVQADVDALNDGALREIELQRRQLKDEREAKELVVRDKKAVVDAKQAVVDEKKAVVTEKQAAVDEATTKLNEAISTRNQYSSQDPSYASVSAASDAMIAAQSDYDDAALNLQVKELLYSSDYQLLVQEANSMAYDQKVYSIHADTEIRYRQDNAIGSAALTPAQQAEVDALADAAAVSILGARETYESEEVDVYIAAVAAMYSDSDMALAYREISSAQARVTSAQNDLARRQNDYARASNEFYEKVGEESSYYKYQKEVDAAQKALDEAKKPLNEAQKAVEEAQKAVAEAQKALDDAQKAVDQVDQSLTDLKNREDRIRNEELADLNGELTELSNALTSEKTKLTDLENEKKQAEQKVEDLKREMKSKEDALKSAGQTVRDRERALDKAMRALESAKKSDDAQALRNNLDRQNKQEAIEEKRQDIADQEAKVEELLGTDSGTEVKSNVAGKVQSLSVSAGHKAEAGKTLAVIEVPDLGYSMNFSVTNEQARRLKVGDSATVSNFYWGSQIVATLASIQTDPQNPQGSKLLTFDVTGDVTVGNSLTISIGERNANYDMVVPNSAVRSDTNGSFVLMITAKNSPLGNRYFASRVNVEVVASDDQYSAISGAIEAYDSVITTASRNAPISSGDQVRLADSN